jgi:translation initiation factor IF-2
MTEAKEEEKKKPLTLSGPGTLELKKTVLGGQVRQSFSHGRSKMVAVEVRKKRSYAQDAGGKMTKVEKPIEVEVEEKVEVPAEVVDESQAASSLTTDEKATRANALKEAKVASEEAARLAEQEAARKALEPEPEPTPEPVVEAELEIPAQPAPEKPAGKSATPVRGRKELKPEDEESRGRGRGGAARAEPRRTPSAGRKGDPRRRSGKLTIDEALGVREERTRSLASVRRAREKQKQKFQPTEGQKIVREVVVPEAITVQELANRMAERGVDVIKALMKLGVMATINQTIDPDTAELVISEFGHNMKRVSEADVETELTGGEDNESTLQSRAPVVTVMGHVDHGKTSLLDALRKTDVVSGEAGGITQHIGAYQVTMSTGAKISFIDTPGHAAFTEMRARGAKVTDIVVLVVAADDGIMPQTVEAIVHAKAAEVPIIVAINKMDRPDADANRVRTELLQHELVVEEMGGEILSVEVSALEGTNLDKLEETILLQAELLDLKANPDRPADGVVVEAKTERGRGTVATVLVQRGTLRVGDIFVAGAEWGRVRAMRDAHGNSVDEAVPSVPVEVLGLGGTPAAGDEVAVVEDEGQAREVTEFRSRRTKALSATQSARGTLEEMFEKIQEGADVQHLPVVVKADVHGSSEAIVSALNQLSNDEVKVQVLHSGVGGVNESDIILAGASGGLIIGFNVRANPQARELAKADNVEVRYYSIIYNVIDDLRQALTGMLAPMLREQFLGNAEIREVFNISKVGKIAGCMVTEGMVRRGSKVRLVRDSVVIHEGDLSQLKRFKDDAKEVKEGLDCGMAFANYHDMQVGDVIECFDVEEVAREL